MNSVIKFRINLRTRGLERVLIQKENLCIRIYMKKFGKSFTDLPLHPELIWTHLYIHTSSVYTSIGKDVCIFLWGLCRFE